MLPGTPRKKRGKRAELDAWIAETKPAWIGEPEFQALLSRLAPVSESYLRKLLRESGLALAPLVEGVRQTTFEELERSLLTMFGEYEHSGHERQAVFRRLVIAAKDHAKWAARNPEKRADKEEMILWMTTWLENPAVFPAWVKLRRAQRVK